MATSHVVGSFACPEQRPQSPRPADSFHHHSARQRDEIQANNRQAVHGMSLDASSLSPDRPAAFAVRAYADAAEPAERSQAEYRPCSNDLCHPTSQDE